MKTYAKGARSERELLHFLNNKGFAVVRAPSSGGEMSSIDVVAIKNGKPFAFEIKAWSKKPKLGREQLSRFLEWCKRAGALGFLAWYNENTWRFLPIKNAEENRYDDENWLDHNQLIKVIDF